MGLMVTYTVSKHCTTFHCLTHTDNLINEKCVREAVADVMPYHVHVESAFKKIVKKNLVILVILVLHTH